MEWDVYHGYHLSLERFLDPFETLLLFLRLLLFLFSLFFLLVWQFFLYPCLQYVSAIFYVCLHFFLDWITNGLSHNRIHIYLYPLWSPLQAADLQPVWAKPFAVFTSSRNRTFTGIASESPKVIWHVGYGYNT